MSVTGTIGVDYLYDDVTGELLVDDVTGEPLTADGAELGREVYAFSVSAASGGTATGTAAVTFGFSESLTGAQQITASGAVSFGFSAGGYQLSAGRGPVGLRRAEPRKPRAPITAEGGVRFAVVLSGEGDVNDDDLVILLAA